MRVWSLLGRGGGVAVFVCLGALLVAPQALFGRTSGDVEARLSARLADVGYAGRVESPLEPRLGRRVDPRLADIGRLLWFDTVTGLNGDNSCAGCHSPTNHFGDRQPIAIRIHHT